MSEVGYAAGRRATGDVAEAGLGPALVVVRADAEVLGPVGSNEVCGPLRTGSGLVSNASSDGEHTKSPPAGPRYRNLDVRLDSAIDHLPRRKTERAVPPGSPTRGKGSRPTLVWSEVSRRQCSGRLRLFRNVSPKACSHSTVTGAAPRERR